MSEHDEQVGLFNLVAYDSRFCWLFAIPNGGARHPVVAMKMRSEGVKAGVWDLCLPAACAGYHGIFIEMKFGRNKLTPKQVEFREYVEAHGYKTAVCHSAEEAYAVLMDYMDSCIS